MGKMILVHEDCLRDVLKYFMKHCEYPKDVEVAIDCIFADFLKAEMAQEEIAKEDVKE